MEQESESRQSVVDETKRNDAPDLPAPESRRGSHGTQRHRGYPRGNPYNGKSPRVFQESRVFRASKPIDIPQPKPPVSRLPRGSPSRHDRRFGRKGYFPPPRKISDGIQRKDSDKSVPGSYKSTSDIFPLSNNGSPMTGKVVNCEDLERSMVDAGKEPLEPSELGKEEVKSAVTKNTQGRSRGKTGKNPDSKRNSPKKSEKSEKEVKPKDKVKNGKFPHVSTPSDGKKGKQVKMEEKDCPLCLEQLDSVESNLYPCQSCKYQICLFCLNRLKEEASSLPTNESNGGKIFGVCPGCRNPYPSDDEWKVVVTEAEITSPEQKKKPQQKPNRVWKDNDASNKLEKVKNTSRERKVLPSRTSSRFPFSKNPQPQTNPKSVSRESPKKVNPTNETNSRQPPTTSQSISPSQTDIAHKDTKAEESEEPSDGRKVELVSLLSKLGLNPNKIRFQPKPE